MILSLAASSAAPPATLQGFVTIGMLRSTCHAEPDQPNPGDLLCLGYVAGVTDGLLVREARRRPTARKICLAPNVTVEELRDTILTYAADPSSEQEVAAALLVRVALEAEFPCFSVKPVR